MNKPVVNANRICEQYTLIFKHEINDNGIPYKIEEPIIARCVLPLTEPYSRNVAPRSYIYDKLVADLLRAIRERLEEVEE